MEAFSLVGPDSDLIVRTCELWTRTRTDLSKFGTRFLFFHPPVSNKVIKNLALEMEEGNIAIE